MIIHQATFTPEHFYLRQSPHICHVLLKSLFSSWLLGDSTGLVEPCRPKTNLSTPTCVCSVRRA